MSLYKKFFQFTLFIACLSLLTSCVPDNEIPFEEEEIPGSENMLPSDVIFPANNPYTEAKFTLGRSLFWDPVLSGQKDIACATCHHPSFGYADGRALSSGVNGSGLGPNRVGGDVIRRNAPSILNVAFNGMDENGNYNPRFAPMFWDNRADGLEEQALLPILSHDEMRGVAIAEADIIDTVVNRLSNIDEYLRLFEAAFGNQQVNEQRIAQALATFQRTIIANNSPFDEYMNGNEAALSPQEIQGMNTFIDVGCADCHSGSMFSDFELHTLSVPDHPLVSDDGATGNFDFRTPSLRNLQFTAPYMHNGGFNNLREVLEFYDDISRGNGNSQNPNVNDNQIAQEARQLNLNNGEINEIIQFLNALNDDDFDRTIPNDVPSGLNVGGLD